MIYFFFRLLYSEKRRTRPRQLPREYYSKEQKTSPLYYSLAPKSHISPRARIIILPQRESQRKTGDRPQLLRRPAERLLRFS